MNVVVKAKDGFVHGPYRLESGQEAVMDESLAKELGGLVEIVSRGNKMAPDFSAGNVQAGGVARPLYASEAAHLSAKATASELNPGGNFVTYPTGQAALLTGTPTAPPDTPQKVARLEPEVETHPEIKPARAKTVK